MPQADKDVAVIFPPDKVKAHNLNVLQRLDKHITDVILTCSYVKIYSYHAGTAWDDPSIVGSLFVTKRDEYPYYQAIVLNKKCDNDAFIPLSGTKLDVSNPDHIYLKTEQNQVLGIWVYQEREKLAQTISQIIQEENDNNNNTQNASTPRNHLQHSNNNIPTNNNNNNNNDNNNNDNIDIISKLTNMMAMKQLHPGPEHRVDTLRISQREQTNGGDGDAIIKNLLTGFIDPRAAQGGLPVPANNNNNNNNWPHASLSGQHGLPPPMYYPGQNMPGFPPHMQNGGPPGAGVGNFRPPFPHTIQGPGNMFPFGHPGAPSVNGAPLSNMAPISFDSLSQSDKNQHSNNNPNNNNNNNNSNNNNNNNTLTKHLQPTGIRPVSTNNPSHPIPAESIHNAPSHPQPQPQPHLSPVMQTPLSMASPAALQPLPQSALATKMSPYLSSPSMLMSPDSHTSYTSPGLEPVPDFSLPRSALMNSVTNDHSPQLLLPTALISSGTDTGSSYLYTTPGNSANRLELATVRKALLHLVNDDTFVELIRLRLQNEINS